jgi:hypothetical protein
VISEISLASVAGPQLTVEGQLLSLEGRVAEACFEGEKPLTPGSLVQFQTPDTLYLGEIESAWTQDGAHHIRVLIEHSVDLERAANIRHLWNSDSSI